MTIAWRATAVLLLMFFAQACTTVQRSTDPLAGMTLANVALSTPDPEKLRAFYEQVLGFRMVRKAPGVEGVELTVIEKNGLVIDLIRVPNQEPLQQPKAPPRHLETPGLRNLVFWVNDLQAANTHLKKNNVTLLFESLYVEGIKTSITAFRDPDGNLIAFWQR